jgi:uncharacterized protein YlxW (UPF0749 family)
MPPGEGDMLNRLYLSVVGGAMALSATLILAGFAYTWAESSTNVKEKSEWRKEHQQVLDKKFEEIKANQERLAQKIEQSNDRTRDSNDRTRDLLQQVLEEQRRFNDRVGGNSNNPQRSKK